MTQESDDSNKSEKASQKRRSFILRSWPVQADLNDDRLEWRFTVRDVSPHAQNHHLGSLTELINFLIKTFAEEDDDSL